MINAYAIHTPAYTHPTTGRTIGAGVLVVAGSTIGPYSRKLTAQQAVKALVAAFPALAGLALTMGPECTMRRTWCDVPCP